MWLICICVLACSVSLNAQTTSAKRIQEIGVRLIADFSVYEHHGRYAWRARDYLLQMLNMSENVFRSFNFETKSIFGHRVCSIKIHRRPGSAPYNQDVGHWEVQDLLYQVSGQVLQDSRDFALNILFTYLQIYDPMQEAYYEGVAPRGEQAGLFGRDNTIIVSLYGLDELQIKRVLLHEIAHMYFLDHLDERKVSLDQGNFIMSPQLVIRGPNNLRFHSSSIEMLNKTLQAHKSRNDYLDAHTCYVCGNGIPQPGEQCDDTLEIPFEEFSGLVEMYRGWCDSHCQHAASMQMIEASKPEQNASATLAPSNIIKPQTLQPFLVSPQINHHVGQPPSNHHRGYSTRKRKPPLGELIKFLPIQLSKLEPIWKAQYRKWKSGLPSFEPSRRAIKAVLQHEKVERKKKRLKGWIDKIEHRKERLTSVMKNVLKSKKFQQEKRRLEGMFQVVPTNIAKVKQATNKFKTKGKSLFNALFKSKA